MLPADKQAAFKMRMLRYHDLALKKETLPYELQVCVAVYPHDRADLCLQYSYDCWEDEIAPLLPLAKARIEEQELLTIYKVPEIPFH